MINYTRAFDSAWERMVTILFRPFDLGKWFVIGFSAFLAGLLSGGNGFNGSYNHNSVNKGTWSASYNTNIHHINSSVSTFFTSLEAGMWILVVAAAFVFVMGIIILCYWLGSRGQFLLLDNVVRNRGAIAIPWRAYARPGNNLFGFYLLYLLATVVVLIPFGVAGFFVALPFVRNHHWPVGAELPIPILLGLVYLLVVIAFVLSLFLFRELGVPLMFRHGLTARAAFVETWRLIQLHPGSMIALILLRIALFVALAVLSLIACCCFCLGAIPYIGTVVLLPAILYIKCFTLDFLAQFGPEYDVWTVDVPPVVAPVAPPPEPNLPPPPL